VTPFDWLSRIPVVIAFLGATAAFAAVFQVLHLPDRLAAAWGYAGGRPMFALDTSCDPAKSRALLEAYGPTGRRQVVIAHLVFDFAFPTVYTAFLIGLLTVVGSHLPHFLSGWSIVRALPIGSGLSDLFENLGIIAMALAFPRARIPLSWVTVGFTIMKFSFGVVSLVLAGVGTVIDLWFATSG